MTFQVLQGDCVELMAAMPAGSVDAVVCDPPYGIRFMGKAWDGADIVKATTDRADAGNHRATGNPETPRSQGAREAGTYDLSLSANQSFQAWCETWARECLRVLKPGGHLLASCGTRTYHRMTSGIEDAGFEIRDTICWMYGSGFPKSLDVGKAIDRAAGAEREVVGSRTKAGMGSETTFAQDAWTQANRGPVDLDITAPATPEAERWEGWGTALKPAHEPVVVARKPLSGTVAATVLEHGTGALNIDATRIGSEERTNGAGALGAHGIYGAMERNDSETTAAGRWPANCVLDEEAARLLDEQTGEQRARGNVTPTRRGAAQATDLFVGGAGTLDHNAGAGDSGGASRFFYVAKASRGERNAGLEGFEEQRSGTGALRAEQGGEYLDFLHPVPEGIGAWLREAREAAGLTVKAVAAHFPSRTGGLTGCVSNWEQEYNRPTPDQWRTLREVIGFDDRYGEVMTALRPVPHAVRDEAVAVKRNTHPTIKPISLMRWLVRLVTPPGGTVLDPFTGSGSTGCAAVLEGFDFIGLEREAEYVDIARARIAWWLKHRGDGEAADILAAGEARDSVEATGQLGMFDHNDER